MKTINLTLPEWAFLDGQSHLGNTLQDRTVLLHIRSNTVLEIFESSFATTVFKRGVASKQFQYDNALGICETHTIAVHYSLAENNELANILDKAIQFYTKYLAWEDANIKEDLTSQNN